MTLATIEDVERAFRVTEHVKEEWRDPETDEFVEPIAHHFGIEATALAAFAQARAAELTDGLFLAMSRGTIPRDPEAVGQQVAAALVRGICMGVVLERGKTPPPTPKETS